MTRSIDFSKATRNPWAARLKKPVTIRLDTFTIDYFKTMAAETGIPYQSLINLYLRECAGSRRKLAMKWQRGGGG
ncbi:MAG: BrnA antitoxin family protein [Gemmatimonadales bacterium]|nr:BrnA antitoxin family protein [Gemmatimonadales bacterium]